LIIEIAIDYEQNVRFVTIEDLENWGKTKQEIFDLANYNFFRDKDSPLEEITLDNGFKIYYYNVKDGYDATRILLSNRFKEKTIVAIPNRDSLFAMKFEFNIERILFFKSMIYKYWQTQNYAISPELYVYEDGKLREWYKGE
jgi:uncharacterized protein YtpQ (UPF0354 family)